MTYVSVQRTTSWKFCQKMSRDPLYCRQLIFDVPTELPSVKVFINICIHHSASFYTFNFFRKDVRLPVQLQRAMAAEAEAAREARAKVNSRHHIILTCHHVIMTCHVIMTSCQVIAAEGEQKASRALREASNTIAESSSALQLRYLQVRRLDN